MKERVTHSLIGIILLICAYVQINDPDPWIWIAVYLLTASLTFCYAFGVKIPKGIILAFAVILSLSFLLFVPDLITWANGGFVSLSDAMKDQDPIVELVREGGGLLICLTCTLLYYFKAKGQQQAYIS